jgi:hypothetical protein
MKIATYKLSRERKRVAIKELDTDNYIKMGTTGDGLALKPRRGKAVILSLEYVFEMMLERQQQSDESVKRGTYSYVKIDKNKGESIQNRLRDEKGRPVKKYSEPEDCYAQIKHLRYIDEGDFDRLFKEKKHELVDYYLGKFERL